MKLFAIAFSLIAFIIIIGIGSSVVSNLNRSTFSGTYSDSLIYSTPTTLSPVGEGIASSSLQVNNQTWLNFDGVNDYVRVTSNETTSIIFWYKNRTSSWMFITNVSGTTYVNAVLGTPVQYPVYFNGSDYFIGKTDATHYFNGSIDDFRVYDYELNTTMITAIYTGGRK